MPPTDFKAGALSCLTKDPELPRLNPSTSFWQEPPHPISSTQSARLPETVDIVIIGSGITGCSISRSLLENPSLQNARIIMLEARSVCSGATGRNGGHLVSGAVYDFASMAAAFGIEQAAKVARFTYRNIARVWEVVKGLDKALQEASEIRNVTSTLAFADVAAWEDFKTSLALFEHAVPEMAGMIRLIEEKEAIEKFKFRRAVGVAQQPAGALWPYRLITGILAQLLLRYPHRFSIEAHTAVTEISYSVADSGHPYTITTPRGSLKSSQIIHCTNGYASHLLPRLRGKIFPLRGTMSTQERGSSFPNLGAERSWSFQYAGTLHAETGILSTGLYYMNQNAKTGDIFIGGENQRVDEIFVADDTVVPEVPADNLRTLLPTLFSEGWEKGERPKARQIWSGIMGFTADAMPIVGKLAEKWTQRPGEGEWIAAGFNGYGMDKCWLIGEGLAAMMVGEDISEWFPEIYKIDGRRFDGGLKPEMAWEQFIGRVDNTKASSQ